MGVSNLDHYGRCPECGADWLYERDGTRYTHLVARVWDDRIQEWRCPFCSVGWDRWTYALLPAPRPDPSSSTPQITDPEKASGPPQCLDSTADH